MLLLSFFFFFLSRLPTPDPVDSSFKCCSRVSGVFIRLSPDCRLLAMFQCSVLCDAVSTVQFFLAAPPAVGSGGAEVSVPCADDPEPSKSSLLSLESYVHLSTREGLMVGGMETHKWP